MMRFHTKSIQMLITNIRYRLSQRILYRAHFAVFSFLFIGLVASAGVIAEGIPKELLDVDRVRCMTSCEPSFGATVCKPLCDCTVNEFQKRLSMEQYLDLSTQLSRNEINSDMRGLLDSIAKMCTAKVEGAGLLNATGPDGESTDGEKQDADSGSSGG